MSITFRVHPQPGSMGWHRARSTRRAAKRQARLMYQLQLMQQQRLAQLAYGPYGAYAGAQINLNGRTSFWGALTNALTGGLWGGSSYSPAYCSPVAQASPYYNYTPYGSFAGATGWSSGW